jgi:hypothetical protein
MKFWDGQTNNHYLKITSLYYEFLTKKACNFTDVSWLLILIAKNKHEYPGTYPGSPGSPKMNRRIHQFEKGSVTFSKTRH